MSSGGQPATRPGSVDLTMSVTGSTTTVSIRGELDGHTAPQLRDRLDGLLSQGVSEVVLDLTEMSFIDSSGLGVIAGTMKRLAEENGSLTLRAPSKPTRKLLDVTGLSQLLEIID